MNLHRTTNTIQSTITDGHTTYRHKAEQPQKSDNSFKINKLTQSATFLETGKPVHYVT